MSIDYKLYGRLVSLIEDFEQHTKNTINQTTYIIQVYENGVPWSLPVKNEIAYELMKIRMATILILDVKGS